MVVLPILNGEIQIYVHLTQLNKNIQHVKLVLPTVEETFGRLSRTSLCSRLGAKSIVLESSAGPRISNPDQLHTVSSR